MRSGRLTDERKRHWLERKSYPVDRSLGGGSDIGGEAVPWTRFRFEGSSSCALQHPLELGGFDGYASSSLDSLSDRVSFDMETLN